MKIFSEKVKFESSEDYLKVFKDIYYHLYTNSNVSRAEILIKDISKVLLYSLSPSFDEGNNHFCLDFSKLNQTQFNNFADISLHPCELLPLENLLNPNELKDCKGKQDDFDDRYRQKPIGLSIYNTLNYYDFDNKKP